MTNMPDPTPLTPEQIAALEAMEKAIREPWFVEHTDEDIPRVFLATKGDVVAETNLNHPNGDEWDEKNFSFIAALRNAAPALIASAKALAEAQAKADECEVDWEVWNTENTRLQSALAAAQARIAELVADLATAEARISELVEGLRPFFEWAKHDLATANELQPDLMSFDDDCEADVREFEGNGTRPLLWGDIRRAARLLTEATSHPAQPPTKRESS